MSYNKKTWVTGEVITANDMNRMEDGIADITSEVAAAHGQDTALDNTLASRLNDMIIISDSQPTSLNNEIWINSSVASPNNPIEIPTEEEFETLRNSIATQYSEAATYEVGKYVLYESDLYKCTTEVTTAGTWSSNASKFMRVILADELGQLKSALSDTIYQELNESQTKPASGNAIITQEFRILKNQAYLLTLETDGTATITTRLTNLGETVERLYAGPAVTDMVIIPAYDANYFRVVGTKDFTVSFKTLNSKTVYDLTLTNEQGITLINSKTPLYTTNYAGLINGTAVVSDLDAIAENISYRMNYAVGSTSIPAHTPYGNAWKSESVAYFQSVVKTPATASAGDFQMFVGSDGIYIRNYTASWQNWRKLYDNSDEMPHEYVVDINGTGDYTSLCACIAEAETHQNSVIYVKRGTYDAIAEMLELKGNSYFDDFATSTDQIYVRNGLKIICEPGTVLTAHYTGTNAIVKSYYAPINFRNSDGYIEGLEIDASNCRYCIHDDQWTYTEPYKHTLKNCRLIIDNSENTDWDRRLAFGGGLGVNGYIVLDGCYFKSVGLDGTAYSGYGSAGYHNSPSADAQSAIYVTNCYFADNSTFRLTRHGSSTKITRAFVSGCSLGREMELTYEQTSSTPINCEIIDCNNIVRT